jgi:hypothetical protein
MQLSIVISHYNENLEWVKLLQKPHISLNIFHKGNDQNFQQKIPNIGREAHTYLTYIIKEYNNLCNYKYIIFLQGYCIDHCPQIIEQILNLPNHTTLLQYKDVLLPYNTNELLYNDRNGLPHMYPHINVGAESDRLFKIKNEVFPFVPGAQLFVPNQNILNRSLTFYNNCLQADWNYHPWNVPTDGAPMACIYERLWLSIFDKDIEANF